MRLSIVPLRRRVFRRVTVLPLTLMLACSLAACSIHIGATDSTGQTTTSGSTSTVKVRILKGEYNSTLIEAPVTIDHHGPYHFIVDTGASVSVIDTVLADQLRLPVVGSGQAVSGVGGTETAVPIKISTWDLGKIALPSATVTKGSLPNAEHGQGLQGLLGSDILSLFGTVTIDYSNSTITVYHAASALGQIHLAGTQARLPTTPTSPVADLRSPRLSRHPEGAPSL